jgi:hypothetical protein
VAGSTSGSPAWVWAAGGAGGGKRQGGSGRAAAGPSFHGLLAASARRGAGAGGAPTPGSPTPGCRRAGLRRTCPAPAAWWRTGRSGSPQCTCTPAAVGGRARSGARGEAGVWAADAAGLGLQSPHHNPPRNPGPSDPPTPGPPTWWPSHLEGLASYAAAPSTRGPGSVDTSRSASCRTSSSTTWLERAGSGAGAGAGTGAWSGPGAGARSGWSARAGGVLLLSSAASEGLRRLRCFRSPARQDRGCLPRGLPPPSPHLGGLVLQRHAQLLHRHLRHLRVHGRSGRRLSARVAPGTPAPPRPTDGALPYPRAPPPTSAKPRALKPSAMRSSSAARCSAPPASGARLSSAPAAAAEAAAAAPAAASAAASTLMAARGAALSPARRRCAARRGAATGRASAAAAAVPAAAGAAPQPRRGVPRTFRRTISRHPRWARSWFSWQRPRSRQLLSSWSASSAGRRLDWRGAGS